MSGFSRINFGAWLYMVLMRCGSRARPAQAVAGEAGVPFFSVSGSDFVEMFVGAHAKTPARIARPCGPTHALTASLSFHQALDPRVCATSSSRPARAAAALFTLTRLMPWPGREATIPGA